MGLRWLWAMNQMLMPIFKRKKSCIFLVRNTHTYTHRAAQFDRHSFDKPLQVVLIIGTFILMYTDMKLNVWVSVTSFAKHFLTQILVLVFCCIIRIFVCCAMLTIRALVDMSIYIIYEIDSSHFILETNRSWDTGPFTDVILLFEFLRVPDCYCCCCCSFKIDYSLSWSEMHKFFSLIWPLIDFRLTHGLWGFVYIYGIRWYVHDFWFDVSVPVSVSESFFTFVSSVVGEHPFANCCAAIPISLYFCSLFTHVPVHSSRATHSFEMINSDPIGMIAFVFFIWIMNMQITLGTRAYEFSSFWFQNQK